MDAIREMSRLLARVKDEALIEGFIRSILTANEVREISSRWELVKRLDRGQSQRRIARDLGLSLCKITRGSRELKRTASPFRRMVRLQSRNGAPDDR